MGHHITHMSHDEPISFNDTMLESFGAEHPQNYIYRPACCAAGKNRRKRADKELLVGVHVGGVCDLSENC